MNSSNFVSMEQAQFATPVVSKPDKRINQRICRQIENFMVRYLPYISWIHLLMFIFFNLLIFLPLFLGEPLENTKPWQHFTVMAHYVMWGLWFPLVLMSVIFTGRSWCGLLCPMGAASEWTNKRGMQKPIPAWIKWRGTPIVSFIFITTLGQTVGVRVII